MDEIRINPTFKSLIPPLTKEEFEGLEQNILSDGKIRDAIVVWNGVIVDGHNRYEIAQKHGLTFPTMDMDFEDEDSAKLWIINVQLGRRNLPEIEMIALARLKEPYLKEEAEKRMLSGKADPGNVPPQGSVGKGKVLEQAAAIAGVSSKTYAQGKEVLDRAAPEVLQDLRERKTSIGKVFRELQTGSKICEFCGEEKPMSRFPTKGTKKCLDCKSKKQEKPSAEATEGCLGSAIVNIDRTSDTADATFTDGVDIAEEADADDEIVEISAAPVQNFNKPTSAELTFGSTRRGDEDSKEYRSDLREIRDNVKLRAEHAKTHKRTIEEFRQVFRGNAEKLITILEHNIKFMDAETWKDENNRKIALDLIDEVVGAITNLKEEF